MTPAAAPFAHPAAPILAADSLAGERGEQPLFRHLSFTLHPGQMLWLRGRNGRGKTSLLRLLAGLASPAEGHVLLDGKPVHSLPAAARKRLLYLAHANALKEDLTVAECLRFLACLQGLAVTDAAVATALRGTGIAALHARPVRTLSQGQRRRAALARLALHSAVQPAPAVWLLDEPFDALDDDGIAALNVLLARHVGGGGSVLLTSHQALTLPAPVPARIDLDDFAVAA